DAFTAKLDAGLTGQAGREFATTPLRMEGPVLQGVLIDEAIEVLFQRARDFTGSAGTWTVHQARRALLGKALHPFGEGRICKVEQRGDGIDVVARNDLTDGLRAAKDSGFLRLLEHGV